MYNFNAYQGFTITIICAIATLCSMVFVGVKKYYLHKDPQGGYHIVEDVEDKKIKKLALEYAVLLAFIMLIESWKPVITPLIERQFPRQLVIMAGLLEIAACGIFHYVLCGVVVVVTTKWWGSLLEKRKRAIIKSRERRDEVKRLCDEIGNPD